MRKESLRMQRLKFLNPILISQLAKQGSRMRELAMLGQPRHKVEVKPQKFYHEPPHNQCRGKKVLMLTWRSNQLSPLVQNARVVSQTR